MPYEPFPYEGSQTSGSSEGGFAKKGPFFSFFISFFSSGPCPFFFFLFLGRLWAGTPWVVTYATSGLLPDNTGSQWEMSNFGGGGGVISLHRCQF